MAAEEYRKQTPPFKPTRKDQRLLRSIYQDKADFDEVRNKQYTLLGSRTPQQYWTEQEKRFVSFAPPKDLTEDDWQANIVMGITRNAVLAQVSKTGTRVPECRINCYSKDGFIDTERSRIYQNSYRWSLRREGADKLQQYISLGNYIRGNVAVYEGFENKTIKVDIITDYDPDKDEVETEEKEERRWGPKRQVVPLQELYYPSMFVNDIQDQHTVIWEQFVDYEVLEAEYGHLPRWKYVPKGNYMADTGQGSFFQSKFQMGRNMVHVLRRYGNVWKGGKDRHEVVAGGIPLVDMPLPFNHKKLPFAWGKNNPFTDKFMLGMGVPYMAMDHQDIADAISNSLLDKNTLHTLRPIMTDDPDPSARTYLSPGGLLQFTKGSTYMPAPLEGVSSSEMQMMMTAIQQAKEFSGAYGGGTSASPQGGSVTARQAVMHEEETKRLLGISMTNLEYVERDIATMRLPNLMQFAPGADMKIEASDVQLHNGAKGRFIAYFTKTLKEAVDLEAVDYKLSQAEIAGFDAGVPTEAVAISPDWFDMNDRIEAECVPESSYNQSKALEAAMANEDYVMLQPNPLINQEELLRDLLKTKNKDPEKLMMKASSQLPPMPQGEGQESAGAVNSQLSPANPMESLNSLVGA